MIGKPVRHSLSPLMHNAAFSNKGINAVYLAFEPDDIKGAVSGMRSLNIRGMSVTIPFKTAIMPLLNEIDPLANKIGAVNTVVNRNNRLTGYNTDASGAFKALEEVVSVKGKSCIIVGAGGAARAIGYMLRGHDVDIMIANRSSEKGRELSRSLDARFIETEKLDDVNADILINATSVGMSPCADSSPVPENVLKPGMTVMDIIYKPHTTRLLHLASKKGCRTVKGIGMSFYQGPDQFKLWTNEHAYLDVIKKRVEEYLYK